MIQNCVEVGKGYAGHEKSLFEKVTSARASAMTAEHPAEKEKAEQTLSSALKTLFAVAENYPNLKATENFGALQKELANIEDTIQSARRYYNAATREYNNAIAVFPRMIVARMLGFGAQEFFGANEAERGAVKVSF